MKAIRLSIISLLAVLFLCAGAASAQQDESGVPDHPIGAVAGGDAEIRPGDQITLRIFREPELGGTFGVGADGEVVLPKLGRFAAAGLRAGALQDTLRDAYGVYLRDPAVEVVVLRRIAVHGEVRRPDLYLVDLTMTLRDLIAEAGGITEAGNPDRIVIVRDREEIPIGESRSATLLAAELRSGDEVVVGRRSWLAMNRLAVISTAITTVAVFIGTVLPLFR